MKTLSESLLIKEKQNEEIKNARIKKEHKVLLESIQTQFRIESFHELSNENKRSVKSLILEYWNPKTGLTRKGRQFIYENKVEVNKDSSPELIKKYIQNRIQQDINKWIKSISENTTKDLILDLIEEVKVQTSKQLNFDNVLDIVMEYLNPVLKKQISK